MYRTEIYYVVISFHENCFIFKYSLVLLNLFKIRVYKVEIGNKMQTSFEAFLKPYILVCIIYKCVLSYNEYYCLVFIGNANSESIFFCLWKPQHLTPMG